MKKKKTIISVILLMMSLIPITVSAAELIVVANKNVMESQLTKDDLKFIYLGRKKKWDNGARIIFVLYKNKLYQEMFMEEYLSKTPEQFDHYWKQNVFTGNGQMPDGFDNTNALVDYLSKNDGSIGYLPDNVNIGDLKIIKIIQD